MSNIINLNEERKFTSKEIAEWTNKEHFIVLRDIKDEIEKLNNGNMLEFAEYNFVLGDYIDINNQKRPQYLLTKEGVQQIAMRYDAVIRAKVNIKLKELENTTKLPTNFAEALYLAAKLEEEKQKVILERDYAIETKAYISDKKTATALQNSSAKSRTINKLQRQLENNKKIQVKENEYTSEQIAKMFNLYSIHNKPHSQLIDSLAIKFGLNINKKMQNNDYFRTNEIIIIDYKNNIVYKDLFIQKLKTELKKLIILKDNKKFIILDRKYQIK